jgi:DNA (cytosine-5)-methyltransferase 1
VRVGSLFSGIGGMDAGLARAGFDHVFFCESDAYRRDVLRARFPGVPVHDDVCTLFLGEPTRGATGVGDSAAVDDGGRQTGTGVSVRLDELGTADLLCGGFPCQDLSVAGKRAGLAGERSGLFFEFARIIGTVRPRWVLLENVPGLLSSNGGRDFGVVLETLADLGYGVAWRTLDSRFFGVPQRRRRVFILAARADGDPGAAAERAGEILAIGSRCAGHLASGTEAEPDVAATLGGSVGKGRGNDGNPFDRGGALVVHAPELSQCLTAHPGKRDDYDTETFITHAPAVAAPLTKGSASGEGVNAPGRRQEDDVNVVAFHLTQDPISGDVVPALGRTGGGAGVSSAVAVRRLTPRECERLQGLNDDWTQLGDTKDSPRYSAIGDAVTANVAEWIGGRIKEAA